MQKLSTQSFFNFIEYEKRYSKHTISSYRNDISQFLEYLGQHYEILKWDDVKHFHVRSWMVSLIENNISQRSVNRKLSALKSLFLFLKKQELLSLNPMTKISAPKFGKTLPETVQSDKLERLFDTLNTDDVFDFRNRLILELFYTTGIRRAELIALKCSDVDHSYKSIKVLGKGNKERRIPISQSISDKVKRWIEWREDTFTDPPIDAEYLFITEKGRQLYPKWVYNMVKRYLNTVTTQKKKSPHVLRHSFATHLMDGGAELNAVKDLLGHANLAATQVYTHNSIEKLKKVYKSAHPKYVEKS